MGKSVLITGAFGNIGLRTLNHLLAAGHRVVCFDRDISNTHQKAKALHGRIDVVWGDIGDRDALEKALGAVDSVVHLAGVIPPITEQDAGLTQRVNVDGTKTLIELMEASGKARRLIFASTMGVFGTVQNRNPPLTNEMPITPSDNYGRSKAACEEAIRASSLDWTILRIGAAPPVESDLSDGAHDPSTLFEMTPDARIEMLHPEDAGVAFANAVSCDDTIGKALFLGGGKTCQILGLEFANLMLDASGVGGKLTAEAFRRSEHPEFYGDWMDTEESQQLLHFQNHTRDDFLRDLKASLGIRYYLIRMIAPLARRAILKKSPYWQSRS